MSACPGLEREESLTPPSLPPPAPLSPVLARRWQSVHIRLARGVITLSGTCRTFCKFSPGLSMFIYSIKTRQRHLASVISLTRQHPCGLSMWTSLLQAPVCSLNVRAVPPLNRLHSLYVGRPHRVTSPVPSNPWENSLPILQKGRRFRQKRNRSRRQF